MPRKQLEPAEARAAVDAVAPWLRGECARPSRAVLAKAVRLSLRTLEALVPGRAVEVRVPPFAAVQCIEGPGHTRGTPPNVIETDPETWLALATGRVGWAQAVARGTVRASGQRADLAALLPILRC